MYAFAADEMLALMIGFTLIALFTLWIILDMRLLIVVKDDVLSVYKGKKCRHQFEISKCGFKSRISTGGSNIGANCKLIVIDEENEETILIVHFKEEDNMSGCLAN